MKIVQNKWINRYIPFPGFKACNLFGVLFVGGKKSLSDVAINHEAIHTAQIIEVMLASIPVAGLLWIISNLWLAGLFVLGSYYLWYGVEWLVHFLLLKDVHMAYRRICFEREAYGNQEDPDYLPNRCFFSFFQFL